MLANRMMMAAAVGGGGIDAYTVLMAHMNGTDNAQVFTDSSDSEHTMTANGNVKTENTQKKFGETSAYFDGSDDYITLASNPNFAFGTGDFTIDLWVRFLDTSTFRPLVCIYSQSSDAIYWDIYNGNMRLYLFGTGYAALIKAWSPSIGTWYHIAFVRSSGTGYFFVDGTILDASGAMATDIADNSNPLAVGAAIYDSRYFNGYIDELRISKGIARWTENFTPPSAPYS